MLILFYFFLSLAALAIATYTDLKERMVYDKLTYSVAAVALLAKGLESFLSSSPEPIILSIAGGAIAFIASYAIWRLGVWAGGDVKLVTALALANPVNYVVIADFLGVEAMTQTTAHIPVFSVSLIVYSALALLPLGLLMIVGAAFKHPEVFRKAAEEAARKGKQVLGVAVLASGSKIALEALGLETLLVLLVIMFAALLPNKLKLAAIATAGLVGAALSTEQFVFGAVAIVAPLLIGYGLWKFYSESREFAFKEEIRAEKLEEGMIPDKYIVEADGKVEFREGASIKKVIKQLMNNRMEKAFEELSVKGRIIANPMRAGGLTEEEAEELREKARKGGIPKTIKVRKTTSFVPAILIGYLALQLTGDVLWQIIILGIIL